MAWTGCGHERGKKWLSASGRDLNEAARIASRLDTKCKVKRGISLTANFWCEQLGEGWVQLTEMRRRGKQGWRGWSTVLDILNLSCL